MEGIITIIIIIIRGNSVGMPFIFTELYYFFINRRYIIEHKRTQT